LILGLLQPKAGRILIDDKILSSTNLISWRKCIASVPQSIVLNDQSVYENIAFGIPYNEIDFDLVHESAKKANIFNDILSLKNGFETKTGDKGLSLSGGQRQLIAFVMATQLIPKLLLLDEPTAALDPQAATTLLKHAGRFITSHRVTTMMITHDPYIAMSMGNKIWVLENGVITKTFSAEEKKKIHPNELIGHIDYAQIAG
jgi:ATP-binding cassette subfamily B protein